MENQLTEFIALTSFSSERLKGQREVPLGVIEKILSISHNMLNIPIEGMETKIYRRGSVNFMLHDSLVVEKQPISLESLDSKYFDKEKKPKGTTFSYTETFRKKIDIIVQKSYMLNYENAITELIEIWKNEGGLLNLTFFDLFRIGYGGISFVIGGLEIILDDIYWYARKTLYLDDLSKPDDFRVRQNRLKSTDKKIRNTLVSVFEKIDILKNADKFRLRLGDGIQSLLRKRLLVKTKSFPSNSVFFDIVEALASCLLRVWEIIRYIPIEYSKQMQLFSKTNSSNNTKMNNIIRQLEYILESLWKFKGWSKKQKPDTENLLIEIIEMILTEIKLWNRALLGQYDFNFFSINQRSTTIYDKPRNSIAFYDIKKSSYILNIVKNKSSYPILRQYSQWFKRITAVPKNWAILFGGEISPKEENAGDKLSAYFDSSLSCVRSVAMSMYHLDMLDKISEHPFQFQARAGLGEADVFVAGEQEHSLLINYIAHAIEKLADLDLEKSIPEPYFLVLGDFLREHPQWNSYRYKLDEEVEFKEVVAFPILIKDLPDLIIKNLKEISKSPKHAS